MIARDIFRLRIWGRNVEKTFERINVWKGFKKDSFDYRNYFLRKTTTLYTFYGKFEKKMIEKEDFKRAFFLHCAIGKFYVRKPVCWKNDSLSVHQIWAKINVLTT